MKLEIGVHSSYNKTLVKTSMQYVFGKDAFLFSIQLLHKKVAGKIVVWFLKAIKVAKKPLKLAQGWLFDSKVGVFDKKCSVTLLRLLIDGFID